MRRPLFWVCMALSAIAVLWLIRSGAFDRDGIRERTLSGDAAWLEERLRIEGRVCGKEFHGDQSYFLLTDLSIIQNAAASRQLLSIFQQMKTDQVQCVLAADQGDSMPQMGSRVLLEGQFSFFREPTNPGEFDTAGYYQGRRIGGKITEILLLRESEDRDLVREILCQVRDYFGQRLDKIFPDREAGVMRAMLLGDRSRLDPELKGVWQKGGILHILSISGLHVTLLGMGLYRLLRKAGAPNGLAVSCAGVVLILYGLMTGMSISAVRAIGMFLLRMTAHLIGRTYDLLTALGVMACGILCLMPVSSLNSGFWLSFGSMMGVGAILPVLEASDKERAGNLRRGGRFQRWVLGLLEGLRGNLRAGFAVFLASLPLLLLFYFEVATYSVLINLLVIPLMGPVVLCGFLAMLIPGLGFLGTACVIALKLFELACRLPQNLPFSTWNPGCPKAWQVLAYYGVLAITLGISWKRIGKDEAKGRKGKTWQTYGLAMAAVLLFAIPARRMTGVTFLDVGQGDCALLRLSGGQTWIYDCGSSNRSGVGSNVLIPYLKHEGIRRIDGIFISHGDKDHVSGIEELLSQAKQEGIQVGCLYLPERKNAGESFSKILELSGQLLGHKTDAGIQFLKAGDVLRGKGVTFLTLGPGERKGAADLETDENEESLCLWIQLEQRGKSMTILLTGDVQGDGEERLLEEMRERKIREVTILKCAHHGSKAATSPAFLEWVDAQITVISCGRNNVYGHPHAELLERLGKEGCVVYRTDRQGSIMIQVLGDEVMVIPFCE